jgi:hypothetical protein
MEPPSKTSIHPCMHCTALHCILAVSKRRQAKLAMHQQQNPRQGSTPGVGWFFIYPNCILLPHPISLLQFFFPAFPLRYTAFGTTGPCLHCISSPLLFARAFASCRFSPFLSLSNLALHRGNHGRQIDCAAAGIWQGFFAFSVFDRGR